MSDKLFYILNKWGSAASNNWKEPKRNEILFKYLNSNILNNRNISFSMSLFKMMLHNHVVINMIIILLHNHAMTASFQGKNKLDEVPKKSDWFYWHWFLGNSVKTLALNNFNKLWPCHSENPLWVTQNHSEGPNTHCLNDPASHH